MGLIRNFAFNRILWFITAVLALTAAAVGVFGSEMYEPVVGPEYLPGVFTQDLLVILMSLVMLGLALRAKPYDYRSVIVIFGVLGFLFYAYGIYAIEQVYTPLYLLYLAVLAFSFYVLAYGLASLENDAIETLALPPLLRNGAAGYAVLIAVMFNVIWISQLIPLLQTHVRVEYTFSVYIIDLVFIMPTFVLTAFWLLRWRALGIVGIPAMFILGFGILSPLALAEALAPVRYGRPMNPDDFWLFGILSLIFLIFAAIYLIALKPANSDSS